jgi:hypothetical protein
VRHVGCICAKRGPRVVRDEHRLSRGHVTEPHEEDIQRATRHVLVHDAGHPRCAGSSTLRTRLPAGSPPDMTLDCRTTADGYAKRDEGAAGPIRGHDGPDEGLIGGLT